MKNLSSASAQQNTKFLFFSAKDVVGAEIKNAQIKAGKDIADAEVWSNKEQTDLGTKMGLEMLKRDVVSAREVQSGDTVSAITLAYKNSGKLDIKSIYGAKTKYAEGARPTQDQIDTWNTKSPQYAIPADAAAKMIAGETIPMGYANFLFPGQYVWVEGTDTVVIGKEKPTDTKEKTEDGIKDLDETKNLEKTEEIDPVIVKDLDETKDLEKTEEIDPVIVKDLDETKDLEKTEEIDPVIAKDLDETKDLEISEFLQPIEMKVDNTYMAPVIVKDLDETKDLKKTEEIDPVIIKDLGETKDLEKTTGLWGTIRNFFG